ncbi:putative WD repeat-containing protein 43-like, partial [Capsicum annuum]
MRPFKWVTGDEFLYCPNGLYRALLTRVHRQLRDHDNNDLLKRTHSIFSFHLKDSFFPPFLKSELIHFKLLKVLELRHLGIGNFPVQILSLIWLRYLSLLCHVCLDIPREICRLWNLQTFIVQGLSPLVKITVPEEIWGLMQLRHLKLPAFYLPDCPSGSADKGRHPKRPRVYFLPDCPTKSAVKGRHLQLPRLYFPNCPSRSVDKGRHLDLSNLQTISYLSPLCCKKEVIMGIQNVKELGISGYETEINSIRDSGILNNLVHLQQLETLSFMWCSKLFPESARAFPAMLKKLKLERTSLSWSYLDIIAELPNLEVLKLMDDACGGKKWHPIVRGFNKLKFLLIEDIHTLQLIELRKCPPKLGESAARIQKEQEDLGNNPVDVCISDPC